MPKELAVVLNNIRSCHNVGSILRTAEFFGVKKVYFVGVTPYPLIKDDDRLPHVREKLDAQIKKVSLGSEENLIMEHVEDLSSLIDRLKLGNWKVVALEQDVTSVELGSFKSASDRIALVLGTEVTGLDQIDLSLMDEIIEIPKTGKKESLNVSVAFGVAISYLTTS